MIIRSVFVTFSAEATVSDSRLVVSVPVSVWSYWRTNAAGKENTGQRNR